MSLLVNVKTKFEPDGVELGNFSMKGLDDLTLIDDTYLKSALHTLIYEVTLYMVNLNTYIIYAHARVWNSGIK